MLNIFDPASYTAPQRQQNAFSGGDPELDRIRAGIFAGESGGDYDALFGYSNRDGGRFAGRRVTDMTIDEALAFAKGEYGAWSRDQLGYTATPMGAYQVVGTTLEAAKQALGLTGTERLTPEMQDRIGRWIYDTQGVGAWEGYRGPQDPGSGRISGNSGGQSGGYGHVFENIAQQSGGQSGNSGGQNALQQLMQFRPSQPRNPLDATQFQTTRPNALAYKGFAT